MMKNIQTIRSLFLLTTVFVSALFLMGCAGNKAYHELAPFQNNCFNQSGSDECRKSYLQHFENHTLAIAEFTERGNAFSDKNYNDILNYIKEQSEETGVVSIVFVHGWKHNSRENDTNLRDFKRVIAAIAADGDDFNLGNRKLVGVYVGWRGQSLKIPLLQGLTYWERKVVAEELGTGGLTRLLADLDVVDRERPENVLITIGHSFGGAAVLKASSEPLLINLLLDSDSTLKSGFGDGVYLLNPAIEANHLLPLYETAYAQNTYSAKQPPLLVTMSSEADWANKFAFPIGQTVGMVFNWNQREIEREFFVHHETGNQLKLNEKNLDSTTVGNFSPFLTHRLDTSDVRKICESRQYETPLDVSLTQCTDYQSSAQCGPKRFPKGLDRLPEGGVVANKPKYSPLYFVRTDNDFMSGHNDIFNPHVTAFLAAQLNQHLRSIQNDNVKSNALFHDEDLFFKQYNRFIKFGCPILNDPE